MSQSPYFHPLPALSRYGSAPGSLLASIADSVVGDGDSGGELPHPAAAAAVGPMGRFLAAAGDSPCLTSESSCRATPSAAAADLDPYRNGGGVVGGPGLQRSFGVAEIAAGYLDPGDLKGGAANPLVRHSSSPAGFFSHLLVDDGFSVTRGIGHYSQPATSVVHAMGGRRLKSQLSFSRRDALSQISEIGIPDMGDNIDCNSSDETAGNMRPSYISSDFPIGTWDETSSIVFSGPLSKRAKDNNGISTSLSCIDSQFSLPKTSLDMATVENLLQIQQESVPFKIRAKRGCATHPRSIAERERRTRISEKLRKLQELVPNMDKQTSTADMLDLAVQHIRELQNEVQILNQERANCNCTSKQEIS